jgi:hypothetical protein
MSATFARKTLVPIVVIGVVSLACTTANRELNNGLFSGKADVLRAIPASSVAEVRYIRAIDAIQRYGPSYTAGVIPVRLESR